MLGMVFLLIVIALAACGTGSGTGSGYSPGFDFRPPEDLAAKLPPVTAIRPLSEYAARLRSSMSGAERSRLCNWVSSERFPPPQRGLVTYENEAVAASSGKRLPNSGNRDFEQSAFYAARASGHLIGNPGSPVRRILADALRAYAQAGAALDATAMTANGKPFTPDTAQAVLSSTSWTLSYLLVKDGLPLSAQERGQVETWLDTLLSMWLRNYRDWHGRDLRSRWLLGQGDMALALLRGDPALFNRGAKEVATFASYTRPDGSHRFGASRGNRALFYQGVSLDTTLESYLLLDSQGLPVRDSLLPTVMRMGSFWARAVEDPALILPYAAENEAVVTGSDYRRQDRVQYHGGADILLALAPDMAEADRIRRIRSRTLPWPTAYTPSFNATCIAAGLR